jgi:hypothetical protein
MCCSEPFTFEAVHRMTHLARSCHQPSARTIEGMPNLLWRALRGLEGYKRLRAGIPDLDKTIFNILLTSFRSAFLYEEGLHRRDRQILLRLVPQGRRNRLPSAVTFPIISDDLNTTQILKLSKLATVGKRTKRMHFGATFLVSNFAIFTWAQFLILKLKSFRRAYQVELSLVHENILVTCPRSSQINNDQ